jgi:hypothetical protein
MNCELQASMPFVEEIYDQDSAQQPVLNSAGDPFVPGLVRDAPRLLMTIQQNEQTWNGALSLQYGNKINSNTWQGAAPRTVKIQSVGATLLWDKTWGKYYKTNWEFAWCPATWDRKVLDAGYYELKGDLDGDSNITQNHSPILDAQGMPITVPQPLNSDGTKMSQGGSPHWITFKPYQAIPFLMNFRGL